LLERRLIKPKLVKRMQNSMRVLHLPMNVASQISITVRALRDIGVDAQGIVINNSIIQESKGVKNFQTSSLRSHPFHGVIQKLQLTYELQAAIRRADVIHWHFNSSVLPKNLDLKFINFLDRPRIVEFWGSDIRIPDIAVKDNPYLEKLFSDPNNDYYISYKKSRLAQEKFAHYGFQCLIPGPELMSYVQPDLFSTVFRTKARIIPSEFSLKYPSASKQRPVVVHVPSRLMLKGTPSVLQTIEHLKKQYNFDFKLIHNVSHAKAVQMVRDCDIMLDQFVIGGFGVASLEAMAMGKPVICYISPNRKGLPSDCPIVNANQDNLSEVLGKLLENGALRHQIGRRSRAYVEKYHDAHKIARDLVKIYEELIEKNSKKKA